MTTIYVRHDVTTLAEVNALALNEDQRENGAIVLYDGMTCYWSINWATRNEIPGRWYDNSRDGLQLVDGDKMTVLVPVEAEEEWTAMGEDHGDPWIAHIGYDGIDGTREEAEAYTRRFGGFLAHRNLTPWEPA